MVSGLIFGEKLLWFFEETILALSEAIYENNENLPKPQSAQWCWMNFFGEVSYGLRSSCIRMVSKILFCVAVVMKNGC